MEEGTLSLPRHICFGVFELDLHARELRKGGVKVKLHGQPLEILAMLLERPGDVVTREQLRSRMWPDETFVDFDHSLNKAVSKLREALGDDASQPRFIETLPRLGYRLIASIAAPRQSPGGADPAISSLAVLPFINASGDPVGDYLSDGISESIMNSLAQLPKLRVIARTSVFRYKGQEADPQQVSRELGVSALVSGRILQRGERLFISAELVDTRTNTHLWGERYSRKSSDIFEVQEEIAQQISEKLRVQLTGDEKKRLTKRSTQNPEAYHLYLKGLYHMNRRTEEGLERSLDYFSQAIAKDAGYGRAHAGFANACTLSASAGYGTLCSRESMTKARAAALTALELDETLAEAHVSLAFVRFRLDWDWLAAEEEFLRAIRLNPNHATARHWYAICLAVMARFDEAVAQARYACELEPLSLIINTALGRVYHFAGRYAAAIEQYQDVLDMDPNFAEAHFDLGMTYVGTGRYEEAIAEYQKAFTLSGGRRVISAELAHGYALAGKGDEARRILEELRESGQGSSCDLAYTCVALGEIESGLALLERAYAEHDGSLVYVKVDPALASLRDHPRFQQLLRRMALAP